MTNISVSLVQALYAVIDGPKVPLSSGTPDTMPLVGSIISPGANCPRRKRRANAKRKFCS